MSRAYHSASSCKLGERCPRAWAYCYIDGLRDPKVAWEAIAAGLQVPARVRATALGKAVHTVGESYYLERPVAWELEPASIFASGVSLLPRPNECTRIECELPIGRDKLDASPSGVALVVGVPWVGFRDLRVDHDDTTLQVDYKTSSDIARWALTPAQLERDLQCAIYTYDLCERLGVDAVDSRWLYLQTKRKRLARAVDVRMSRSTAREIIEAAAERCRTLDMIARSSDAPQNRHACGDYGGCQYARANGGPCDARPSYAATSTMRVSTMTLDPATLARFQAMKQSAAATATAPADAAATAPADAPPADTTPAPAPADAPAEAPATRTRKPRTSAAAAPAAGSLSAQLTEYATQIAVAEAEIEAAKAQIAALLGR